MIRNSTWKLIRRATGTAAILAVVIVLVVIYVRSSGKGTGVPVAVGSASSAHPGAGSSTGGSGGSSAASGPPPPPPSEEQAGGSGEQAHGGGESPPAKSSSGPSGTYTGPVIQTPYGPVQVAVAEEKGRIVDVKALQLPTEHPQSMFISERVAPLLRSEALEAQSDQINIVTGATFTSEGFASSLQKALLKAG
jgi:uncharacterized protein with FMN-binding domain